jgi:phage shock protein A
MAGYTSILDRVGLLLSANINDLLDRALNANKPAVFDEQINLLQGSLEKITVALGESIGRQRTLERETGELRQQLAKMDQEIDRLLELEDQEANAARKASITTLATTRQANFNTTQEVLDLKEEQFREAGEQIGTLRDAKIKLEARIDTLRAQKGRLLALISERKAAEAQGRALSDADIRSRFSPEALIREEREAVERARGIVAARSISVEEQLDDLLGNDALQEQLEERRARRLGGAQVRPVPQIEGEKA